MKKKRDPEALSVSNIWQYLAPAGWATQWYWPEGTHGKLWNLFHGKGWKIA